MVYNNTFIPQGRDEKQIYFVHNLCSKNKKCSGIQNCTALQNSGFTPPPYYLKSTSTDTFDWNDKEISKNVERYYKTKERMKLNKGKQDRLKHKQLKEETTESNNLYADINMNAPKNIYVYKRKHLVQEITIPRRIKTSVANLLYRSPKKNIRDVSANNNDKLKNQNHKNKNHLNTCKCSNDKTKKKKVELAIKPSPETDKKHLAEDRRPSNTICKCKIARQNVKTSKAIKCYCKGDAIDDSVRKRKKQKHKQLKEKDKITSYYHEVLKKVQFDDFGPLGKEDKDELYDTYDSKLKNGSLLDDRCIGGTCAKAAKNKNNEFVCKCVERKKKPHATECINAICNVTSNSTVAKIKRKIILLCHKYSHILKERKIIPPEEKNIDKQICDVGLCRTAFDNQKENFACKCVKKAKECTDTSCRPEGNWKLNLKKYYNCFMKHSKDVINEKSSAKRNAIDQTGEPFFELKVDSIGLWALNPKEIRTKIEELEKSQKQIKCICPSRKRKSIICLQKEACSSGICDKKYKNKKTNFNCICSANQNRICTDSTCEPGKKNISWSMNNNDPLLEVTLSAKDMKILNTEEVRDKICDIKSKMYGVCSSGVCREAAKDNLKYICQCSQKKLSPEVGECGENICKSRSKRDKGVKSKFSSIYACISDIIDKDKLKNIHSTCEKHCSGNPATCTCCKCMKNRQTKGPIKTMRNNDIHKRKRFSIPSIVPNNNEDDCSFFKHMLSNSYSALLKRVENRRHKFKRNGFNISLKHKENSKIGSKQIKNIGDGYICCKCGKNIMGCVCCPSANQNLRTKAELTDKHKEVRCECGLVKNKEKLKKKKMSKRQSSLTRKQRIKLMKSKRRNETQKSKSRTHDTIQRRKEYIKEKKQFHKELKKKEKVEQKNREKLAQIEKAELEAISKGREAEDTSCFADFCLGVLKLCFFILKGLFTILFKIIFDPKGSYMYIRLKLQDPVGTFERIIKYVSDAWRLKKLQMLKSISGSEKMTILADTLQDTVIFQAFADKGKTPKEKRMFAQKNKQRKIRMEQRNTKAFRSCKHNLLHTLRKTPCLWVYHICPFFYPQCLGILALMKQLSEILLFMLAFIVWTPCIACCETCRAFCCCVLCTN